MKEMKRGKKRNKEVDGENGEEKRRRQKTRVRSLNERKVDGEGKSERRKG